MTTELIYVHDPMCSWCWGFRPTFEKLKQALPERGIKLRYILGGLAPDSNDPMPEAMQQQLQLTWQRIQQHIPNTSFNFDFWTHCKPRRSTYPACRAVIATQQLAPEQEDKMILAIQKAYYTRAMNPSDNDTLITLAKEMGINGDLFGETLDSPETQKKLMDNIAESRRINATSFPSLVLRVGETYHPLAIDYNHVELMLHNIDHGIY